MYSVTNHIIAERYLLTYCGHSPSKPVLPVIPKVQYCLQFVQFHITQL